LVCRDKVFSYEGIYSILPKTEDVADKAIEMNLVQALLFVLDTSKVENRWHVVGCLVCLAANRNIPHSYFTHLADPIYSLYIARGRREMALKGTGRVLLSRYLSNKGEEVMTR